VTAAPVRLGAGWTYKVTKSHEIIVAEADPVERIIAIEFLDVRSIIRRARLNPVNPEDPETNESFGNVPLPLTDNGVESPQHTPDNPEPPDTLAPEQPSLERQNSSDQWQLISEDCVGVDDH
jgi:hypothetical protein